MYFSTALVAAASAAVATAATISVEVGNGALTFVPNDIKANIGDFIEFSFFPKNHSVTQSSFADPCHPLAGGFFSTFVPTNTSVSNEVFTIVVNDTKPIWIYCAQTKLSHCQSGMVASINAPATGNTLAAFTLKAANATNSTSPPNTVPLGGILAVKNSGSVETVTTSITTTITTTVTSGGKTYATTYATSYGITYITALSNQVSTSGAGSAPTKTSGSGSGSGSGSSTTTSVPNAATGLAANGVMVGAVMLGALAML